MPQEEWVPLAQELIAAIVGIGKDYELGWDIGEAMAGERRGRPTGLTLMDVYWATRVMELHPGWEIAAQARLSETAAALAEVQARLDDHHSRFQERCDDQGNFLGTDAECEQAFHEGDAIRAVIREREREHDVAAGHISAMKDVEWVWEFADKVST